YFQVSFLQSGTYDEIMIPIRNRCKIRPLVKVKRA
ncbi:hypothetical protein Ocin01_19165, partial [Orchesella cincta]